MTKPTSLSAPSAPGLFPEEGSCQDVGCPSGPRGGEEPRADSASSQERAVVSGFPVTRE